MNALPPEAVMLELVDDTGMTIGQSEKIAAHVGPGRLHRAFSVFLFDRQGRMLVQRRALTKYHSPGVWSNSCCGHPGPGESPERAAARRVNEELGISATDLTAIGTTQYHHPDPDSGLVEREYNHLFAGRADLPLNPDPAEVAEVKSVTLAELDKWRATNRFSGWFDSVLAAALPAIPEAIVDPRLWGPGRQW